MFQIMIKDQGRSCFWSDHHGIERSRTACEIIIQVDHECEIAGLFAVLYVALVTMSPELLTRLVLVKTKNSVNLFKNEIV